MATKENSTRSASGSAKSALKKKSNAVKQRSRNSGNGEGGITGVSRQGRVPGSGSGGNMGSNGGR